MRQSCEDTFLQNFSSCSTSIGDAIYHSNWYVGDKNVYKMVSFIIHRSQNAKRLTARKFATVSLESYSIVEDLNYNPLALDLIFFFFLDFVVSILVLLAFDAFSRNSIRRRISIVASQLKNIGIQKKIARFLFFKC